MKRVMKFFRAIGDALGLAILLSGLMLATNNVAAGRARIAQSRRQPAAEPARVVAPRKAGAAA